jgi:hypothetical protein
VSRTARLVLVDGAGTVLGALPPLELEAPWWPEAGDVVAAAREHFEVEVTVLRLLSADRPRPPGGSVTYLAELTGSPPAGLIPLDVIPDLSPHPLRAPYAVPGGPARTLAWATDALAAQGWPAITPVQQKTWNLSTVWRLDGADGRRGWFKQVPPFFGHEPGLLAWLGDNVPGAAPPLLAADPAERRMVMRDLPGRDWYDADVAGRARISAVHHTIQLRAAERLDELVAIGVPDRRGARLATFLRSALAGAAPSVVEVVPDLDARLAAAAACGLPDTLVHGDLWPGNTRAVDGGEPIVMDWGDATLGNPAFDIVRLAGGLDDADAAPVRRAWAARWRDDVPGSEPERAAALLTPVAALNGAATYATFLANIEPSEHPYHADDVQACLAMAAELARTTPLVDTAAQPDAPTVGA